MGFRRPTSGLCEGATAAQADLHRDVLFIWERARRISLIHHEGAVLHLMVPRQRGG